MLFLKNPYRNPYSNSFVRIETTIYKRIIQGTFDLIGILICFVAFGIVYTTLNPRIGYITCDMSDISFPYLTDTVPFWAVLLFGVLGPLIVIILVEISNARLYPFQNRYLLPFSELIRKLFIYLFHAISLFVFGISIVLLLTEIGKRWIGRLRPHFLAVCNPNISNLNCTINALTGSIFISIYTGDSFCRGTASLIKEARFSFPSGHASFSTYTMVFLIIYLEARLLSIRFRYIKALVQLSAFIAAYVTSISRIVDYKHRASDVIGGAILGVLVALAITISIGNVIWDTDWFDVLTQNETRFKGRGHDFDSKRYIEII